MLSQHFHLHITTARFWINIFFNKLFFAFSNFVVQENFSNMTQASAEQQRMEVERALREADQGAHFQSKIFKHFIISRKLI